MNWRGAAGGALLTVPLLNDFAVNVGWRIAFGLGVVLGLGILIVRRHVPESPRRLFIHGRDREAEELVDGIEEEVEREKGVRLEEPPQSEGSGRVLAPGAGLTALMPYAGARPRSIAVAMARFVRSATRTGSLIR